jgi:hypothetical protein
VENSNQGPEVVVATTNVGHLSRFVTAKTWDQIRSDEEGAEEIGEETDIRP